MRPRALSDVEPDFVCEVCGKRGADVRPDFNWDKKPAGMMGYRSQTGRCANVRAPCTERYSGFSLN